MATSEFEAALAALGAADALNAEERKHLDERGYLILHDVIDMDWLAQLRESFEQLALDQKREAGREGGTRHPRVVDEEGKIFQRIVTHPGLLAAAYHVLRAPFRCNGMDGRDPLPGFGLQGIHADSWPRSPGEPFRIVNSLWLLDDFTAENGATRVVPGSHLKTGKLPEAAADPNRAYPGEVIVTAPAGSALVFNGHLLHGGTRNRSNRSRRVVRCGFESRDNPQFVGTEQLIGRYGIPAAARFLFADQFQGFVRSRKNSPLPSGLGKSTGPLNSF